MGQAKFEGYNSAEHTIAETVALEQTKTADGALGVQYDQITRVVIFGNIPMVRGLDNKWYREEVLDPGKRRV